MSLDLTGIRNVGEFYSQHYLDSLFASDLQETLKGWDSQEDAGKGKSPAKRLAALSSEYFRRLADASGIKEANSRLGSTQEFHAKFLEALGYTRSPGAELVADDVVVPLVAQVHDHNHRPYVWVLEAPFPADSDKSDPFNELPLVEQFPEFAATQAPPSMSWQELLDSDLFRQEHPPRWVLFLAGTDVFLIDRYKWPQGKYLHFELNQLYRRHESKAFQALAGLLHHSVLVPDAGQSLLDKLDEQSHKHAYGVSTDLKYGIQQAVEILGNEAVYYIENVQHKKRFGIPGLAKELTRECITFLYRLLFLFYSESRGQELGVVPMGADAYRLGYSLECLRDLELVPLTNVQAREGFYIDKSLRMLFELIQRGFGSAQSRLGLGDELIVNTFTLPGVRSALFDESRTPWLKSVKFRNQALQKVLQLLSLSREGNKDRGRISYAQLGINQLGAVYEGLLSYTGFFAEQDVYEVQAKGSSKSDSQSYFVPEEKIGEYSDDEKVKDQFDRPLQHRKGTFLFRLAGRDREKSASYYTPEVLTQCMVKYTLKERLGELGKPEALSADAILKLTVCEPAMGSGAFLNEAVNQLAHAYLERKQHELGTILPAQEYPNELRKVKYHFAVNQAYGVDLNPLACELGKISMWLNILQPDTEAPYLDLHLRTGNSLVGARREFFTDKQLTAKASKTKPNWLESTPERIPLGSPRPKGSFYHFLVPDSNMVAFDSDKVVSKLEPLNIKKIKEWKKAVAQPYSKQEIQRLHAISERVDALWEQHTAKLREIQDKIRIELPLWGQPKPPPQLYPKDAETCEEYSQALFEPTSAGQRLHKVMDYWCALYFWPIQQANLLPLREQWLKDIETLLEPGGTIPEDNKRWPIVLQVAEEKHFFHWELTFANLFHDHGGMDVIVGNPPWLKVQWTEGGVLSDYEPLMAIRKVSAKEAMDRRQQVLQHPGALASYLHSFEDDTGLPAYLNSTCNYPLLKGIQTNLYKCFLVKSWSLGNSKGVSGLFHQPGLFDDSKGGTLRKAMTARLSRYFQFYNELQLFSEVHHNKEYCISVCHNMIKSAVRFTAITNLLHPIVIDLSNNHDGIGAVPLVRTTQNKWNLMGHAKRLVKVDREALELFAQLYDEQGTPPEETKIPAIYSQDLLEVLKKLAKAPRKLGDLKADWYPSQHFHETNHQKDGTIQRETRYPNDIGEWIVSGPHFYIATPLYKTPNEGCKHNQDYTPLDLTQVPEDYLPRTNYTPACPPEEFRKRTPRWEQGGQERLVTEYFRHVHRNMVQPARERTFVPAIVPPGVGHIHTVDSICFSSNTALLLFSGMASSIIVDFFIKSTGKTHVFPQNLTTVPIPNNNQIAQRIIPRALRLNCLTKAYAPLWEELYLAEFQKDRSANPDKRAGSYGDVGKTWSWETPFRTPYARRQALVELDVLAALSLGITLEELILVYQIQFYVLQSYEAETFYDQRGKIVFTPNRGLAGVGLDRKQWEQVKDAQAGDKLPEFAKDAQGEFVAPFTKCDRELDLAQAYAFFANKLGTG
jgi:hypothetical protein